MVGGSSYYSYSLAEADVASAVDLVEEVTVVTQQLKKMFALLLINKH